MNSLSEYSFLLSSVVWGNSEHFLTTLDCRKTFEFFRSALGPHRFLNTATTFKKWLVLNDIFYEGQSFLNRSIQDFRPNVVSSFKLFMQCFECDQSSYVRTAFGFIKAFPDLGLEFYRDDLFRVPPVFPASQYGNFIQEYLCLPLSIPSCPEDFLISQTQDILKLLSTQSESIRAQSLFSVLCNVTSTSPLIIRSLIFEEIGKLDAVNTFQDSLKLYLVENCPFVPNLEPGILSVVQSLDCRSLRGLRRVLADMIPSENCNPRESARVGRIAHLLGLTWRRCFEIEVSSALECTLGIFDSISPLSEQSAQYCRAAFASPSVSELILLLLAEDREHSYLRLETLYLEQCLLVSEILDRVRLSVKLLNAGDVTFDDLEIVLADPVSVSFFSHLGEDLAIKSLQSLLDRSRSIKERWDFLRICFNGVPDLTARIDLEIRQMSLLPLREWLYPPVDTPKLLLIKDSFIFQHILTLSSFSWNPSLTLRDYLDTTQAAILRFDELVERLENQTMRLEEAYQIFSDFLNPFSLSAHRIGGLGLIAQGDSMMIAEQSDRGAVPNLAAQREASSWGCSNVDIVIAELISALSQSNQWKSLIALDDRFCEFPVITSDPLFMSSTIHSLPSIPFSSYIIVSEQLILKQS